MIIFFYSGNFRNWSGLAGLYQTFLPWTKTGIDAAGHGKPDFDLFPLIPPFLANVPGLGRFANLKLNWYWVRLMLDYEWFVLAGLLFSVRFFFGGQPALRYLAIYGLGVLFAYSIVPVQNALVHHFDHVAFLVSRGGPDRIYAQSEFNRLVAVLVSVPLFAQAAWKSYDLNLVRYDNPKERYVYVQTVREYPYLRRSDPGKGRQGPVVKDRNVGLGSFVQLFPDSLGAGRFSQYRILHEER